MLTNLFRMLALDTPIGDGAGTGSGTTAQPTGSSPWILIIYVVVIAAMFYFLLYRPNKKKEKQKKSMLDGMKKGDKITTIGGIEGRIAQIKDNSIIIEVSNVGENEKVKLEIQKWAVGSVDSKNDD